MVYSSLKNEVHSALVERRAFLEISGFSFGGCLISTSLDDTHFNI
jgi:hypothetical protein